MADLKKKKRKAWRQFLKNAPLEEISEWSSRDIKENGSQPWFQQIRDQLARVLGDAQSYLTRHRMEIIHRLRINVKFLRYLVTTLYQVSEKYLGDYPPLLKEMQADLGAIHDLEMLVDYLRNLSKKKRKKWKPKIIEDLDQTREQIRTALKKNLVEWENQWDGRQNMLTKMVFLFPKQDIPEESNESSEPAGELAA